MPKTIRLNPDTYERLASLRDKRETFDDVLQRLLSVYKKVEDLRTTQ